MAHQPPDSDRTPPAFPVAIIGLACRLPGADGIEEFWSLLRSGTDAVGPIPRDRWDHDYFFHPDPARPGRTYANAGGYLRDIDRFDADFFGIAPREARQMDPQQRILLELTWEALEDANLVPARLAGSDTSVFIGVSSGDYGAMQRLASDSATDPYVMSGSAYSICANRISYLFDFHGPSVVVDTACSSALVAVHQACASLRSGDSRIAIAGGINIILTPESFIGFAKAGMLSPTGHCRAFDAEADGYVRSEGGGIVILKPLDAALADGDPIHAVILSSAVNSDGRTKGIALPNPAAQEALLRRIYDGAIDPADVAYVEAHGTGTTAGDRVECTALGRVFGPARRAGDPLRIGSVKTNIGHLEPASGIAGLLKAILTLKHREIPPSLHFKTPNPKIRFDELNLAVARETVRLPDGPVIVGVNSFGFGGTNAHIALRSYETPAQSIEHSSAAGIAALFLSARSEAALKTLAFNYAKFLRAPDGPSLVALGHAAATRRSHHPHRLALFGESGGEVAAKLDAFAAGLPALMLAQGEAAYQRKRIAFVFTGNGSQWLGMGRDLLAREPVFAARVAQIDQLLRPLVGWSLLDILQRDDDPTLYDQTEYAQPALFAVQTGLVALLRARGLDAETMTGHSVGEVAAAHAAGALSLADACLLIACRSQAQSRTAGAGKMAAIGLSEAQATEAIAPYGNAISVASVNSPVSVTLAGDEAALVALGKTLEAKGVFFRMLTLDYAFHSGVMEPLRKEVLTRLAGLQPRSGPYRFISTVTGGEANGATLDADYWWTNIRKPVRFEPAIQALIEDGIEIFLEIGPHPILSGYIRECVQGTANTVAGLPTLRRREPEAEAVWLALTRCYAEGADLDWETLYPGRGETIALPSYPWQRETYWFEPAASIALTHLGRHVHPLLGYRMPVADPVWKSDIDSRKLTYLNDHIVGGTVVFPAAGYIEMALAAALAEFGGESVEIEELEIHRPIVLGDKLAAELEFELAPADHAFRILSRRKEESTAQPVAVGRLAALAPKTGTETVAIAPLKARLSREVPQDAHYARCLAHGLAYGPAFQGVAELFAGDGEALARIETPAELSASLASYHLHPALLDACLQTAIAGIPEEAARNDKQASYVPVSAARIRLFRRALVAWCHVRLTRADRIAVIADFTVLDSDGVAIAELEGVRFQRLDLAAQSEIPAYHWQYLPQAARGMAIRSQLPPLTEIATANSPPATEPRPPLNRLAAGYARQALATLGVKDGIFNSAALISAAYLLPEYEPYLDSLQRLLTGNEVADVPEALWRKLMAAYPDHIASLELIARVGEQLPNILRGEMDAETVLFPGRDFNAGEQLLDSDPAFRRGKEIAADIVRQIERGAAGRTLRILDLGGGANPLAAAILPSLPFGRIEYVLAQRDADAMAKAQSAFAEYPFLHHAVLDLNRDPAGQGFSGQHFDLIIAAHVLRGAEEIDVASAHLRSLLKPAGILLLVESEPSAFLDFVFGLQRGWWSFIDTDRREEFPLLPAAQWQEVLEAAGFAETRSFGGGAATIFLARNADVNGHASEAPEIETGRWVVLAGGDPGDRTNPALAVSRALSEAGHRVLTIGDETPLASPEDYRAFAARLRDDETAALDILYARQGPGGSNGHEIDPVTRQDEGALGLTLLVQALVEAGISDRVPLWIVTRGALSALGLGPCDPAQAPIWSTARVLRNERPGLQIRLIDLDPAIDAETNAGLLLTEFAQVGEEDEIILHGGDRLVPRLMRGWPPAQEQATRETRSYRLALGGRDTPDGLVLRPIVKPAPQTGEVAIRVRAAGLNFRDVLQRIGLLPEEVFEGGFAGATLGMEFAGEIEALGPGMTGFAIGDAVSGFAPNAFRSHLAVPAQSLFRKPPSLSFEAAATLPVAALTVFYSLHTLARLQPGERILIHGAAGGVGLAAVQYAQWIGAEIFASAGTEAKRAFLRRLGVRHVLDSRTLAFADEIRALTSGEGIDVVLNSLAGEALIRGVSLLRPYGRFIELGKRDFHANTKLGLRPFRNNIQFFGVDIDRLLVDRPKMAAELLRELAQHIADGVFRPLPHRNFPVTRAAEAFRHMQHSRHIGKVVLTMPDAVAATAERDESALALPPDATYLITGGRGGFGLATAEWLASKGARHLVLIGRSVATEADAASKIAVLKASGVTVREVALDVTDGPGLAALFDTIAREMPPLRGIVHAAAVIEDASLANMSAQKFRAVLAPKLLGAWHVDRLTRDIKLDFFVLYSSATTLFGNPGQSNYAAANLYLEALGRQRRAGGLPALVMQWGALGGVGHLHRHAEIASTMTDRLGVKLLAPERALDQLERAIQAGTGEVAVADLNWSKLAVIPSLAKSPRYRYVRPNASEASAESGQDVAALREQLAAMAPAQRYAHVELLIIRQLATVLRMPANKLHTQQTLMDLGADSLMVVELQLAFEQQLGVTISPMELMEVTDIGQLAGRVAEKLDVAAPGIEPVPHPVTEPDEIDAQSIDDLPPDMLDDMLGKLLEREGGEAAAERVN